MLKSLLDSNKAKNPCVYSMEYSVYIVTNRLTISSIVAFVLGVFYPTRCHGYAKWSAPIATATMLLSPYRSWFYRGQHFISVHNCPPFFIERFQYASAHLENYPYDSRLAVVCCGLFRAAQFCEYPYQLLHFCWNSSLMRNNDFCIICRPGCHRHDIFMPYIKGKG